MPAKKASKRAAEEPNVDYSKHRDTEKLSQKPISANLLIIFQIADTMPGYGKEMLLSEVKPFVREKIYFKQQEIADRFKVTLDCVKQWCKAKKLQHSLKVPGGTIRYTLADVEQFEELTGRSPKN